MKNLLNTGVYLILVLTVIFLSISGFNSNKRNKDFAKKILELEIVDSYNANLIKTELNSLSIEHYLKGENHFVLEKADKSTISLSNLINDPACLYFYVHENSCSACLEIELNHIKQLSDSLKMPIKFISNSRDWRFMKLLKQSYNLKNEFYRLIADNASLKDELLFYPYYFIINDGSLNFIFIPLKEQEKRTLMYFDFVRKITNPKN
ncbi:MAG: hypothetical protein M0R39_09440 [Prolixibacteraceae bacterium]|nr:hypothetical protein [Prolixibacteraceae bacterium]